MTPLVGNTFYISSVALGQQFNAEGRIPEATPKHKNISKAVITQCGNWLILSRYVEIHDTMATDYVSIDKLLHSALAKDWQ